jgi:hypothetical protein
MLANSNDEIVDEDEIMLNAYILLQHLTLAVPDRADFRSIGIKVGYNPFHT